MRTHSTLRRRGGARGAGGYMRGRQTVETVLGSAPLFNLSTFATRPPVAAPAGHILSLDFCQGEKESSNDSQAGSSETGLRDSRLSQRDREGALRDPGQSKISNKDNMTDCEQTFVKRFKLATYWSRIHSGHRYRSARRPHRQCSLLIGRRRK